MLVDKAIAGIQGSPWDEEYTVMREKMVTRMTQITKTSLDEYRMRDTIVYDVNLLMDGRASNQPKL